MKIPDTHTCLLLLFQSMSDTAEQEPPSSSPAGIPLSSLLSQLIEEECRLLLGAWNELLIEADDVRARREVDEVAAKIAWECVRYTLLHWVDFGR